MVEYKTAMVCEAELMRIDKETETATFFVHTPNGSVMRSMKSFMLMSDLKLKEKTYLRMKINETDMSTDIILSHVPNFRGVLNALIR